MSSIAIQFCRERGIQLVPGQCPFMFFCRRLRRSTAFMGSYARSSDAIHRAPLPELECRSPRRT